MNKFFFSVIVPCWNCGETIERLLDSLVQQDTSKDEFEVILCDDGHEDNWITKIDNYKDKLNIVYCQTKEHKVHCPGNTRRDALPHARGEWITFIDNDDFLVTDALSVAKQTIIEKNIRCMFAAKAVEVDVENPKLHTECGKTITILHGKFYNREFLNKYHITFEENLESHEDLFFNTLVMTSLYEEKEDFIWIDKILYIWVMNMKSLSRSYYVKTNYEKNYLEDHLQDYLYAYGHNYLEAWKKDVDYKDQLKEHLFCSIFYAYLYYQAELYYLKEKSAPEHAIVINYIKKVFQITQINKQELIDYVYKDPAFFAAFRQDVYQTEGIFIENQSFKDFILTYIN